MEKWRKERQIERQRDREIDRKKKEQESAEAISGLKRAIVLMSKQFLIGININDMQEF